MSLFGTPEEHAAHPPQSWTVRKRAERLWGLYARPGDEEPLESFTTRHAAEEHKAAGFWVNLYERDGRWMAGQTPAGMKPYAQVVAERERNEAWQRQRAAFEAAGYSRVPAYRMAELGPGKRCCGGLEELPQDRPAWEDANGWLWCREHLASLLSEPASA